MKLYYCPGACSLSPHIVLREAGLDFDLVRVDLSTHTLPDGGDFMDINPKGYVPLLELDDGSRLSEGVAIVQYVADLKPESGLAPRFGTFERYRLIEWLTFINSEIHKGGGALFSKNTPEEYKASARKALISRYGYAAAALEKSDFLLGGQFTVADAYLFTVSGWCPFLGIDLSVFPSLVDFRNRVAGRPAVRAALEAEARKD
ncbi:MAG: glutathione transferase GstA [Candidatus Accumulibacter sp.]|nr:glutathione transferase GstA [Accumulibacter sp.]